MEPFYMLYIEKKKLLSQLNLDFTKKKRAREIFKKLLMIFLLVLSLLEF